MKDILKYYFKDGTFKVFEKYMLYHFGFIRNRKTGEVLQNINQEKYNKVNVQDDDGKSYQIRIARAIASTFIGPPPSLEHTADHIDKNPDDDIIHNIRWANKSEQSINRDISEINKSAFIVVKDGVEKTINEWVEHLKYEKNNMNRPYINKMIKYYAQGKKYGFSYKKYPDLPDEVWKEIAGSKTKLGRWEISDMNRVKYITKYTENVLCEDRIGLNKHGYPIITINGKRWKCHIISFMSFFPEQWSTKKTNENVLHKNDDKLDFRPHMLRLGNQSDNISDAYNNGCYDDTQAARMKCVSYINGIYELLHDSQKDAVRYLKSIGYEKASKSAICMNLSGDRKSAYGRTWKLN